MLEGNLDEEKLKTGNYIIYTIRPNDNGKYNIDKAEFSVGDKVTVDYKNKPKTYEVLAIAGMNYSFSVRYFILKGDNFAPHMVLPSEEFCKSVDNPLTMSYVYDVKDGTLGKAETHINEYTNSIAKDTENDIVKGFKFGCDDYISKPFSVPVLIQRVDAVLRRSNITNKNMYLCEEEGLKIDFDKMKVFKNNNEVKVAPKEFKLLKLLCDNRGKVLQRERIMEKVWDIDEEFIDSNSLSVAIKRLREKIEDDSKNPKFIITVFGIGYTWGIE